MSNRPGRKIARHSDHRPVHVEKDAPSLDRRVLLIVGAMAVVSVLIGIAVVLTGNADNTSVSQTNDMLRIFGDELPVFDADAATDPAVGRTAPVVTSSDFTGESRQVTGAGRPEDTAKVVGIFAHWCPHCQREVPEVAEWLKNNSLPDRTEVIAISSLVAPNRDNYPPSDWFESVDWPYPVLRDSSDNALADAFGLSTVPYWIVLAPDNTVLSRQSGAIGADAFAALVEQASASVTN